MILILDPLSFSFQRALHLFRFEESGTVANSYDTNP